MTISTTTSKVLGLGNGATTSFPYSFLIPDANSIRVTFISAAGVQSVLSASQFAVSGLGSATGGTVTYPLIGSPIASGTSLLIERVVALTQPTSLLNQGGFFPSVVETAFDRVVMMIQQLANGALNYALALTFPSTDTSPTTVLPPAAARANKYLAFDGNGNPLMATGSALAGDVSLYTAFPTGGTAPRTIAAHLGDFVTPEDYGAVGNGVTDDTTALQAAIGSTRNVRAAPGVTYLINGGLSATTVGQLLDFSQATIKLKNSAGTKGMLTVAAVRTRVIGGTWDGNKGNNGTGDQFGHFAILVTADGCTVQDAYSLNSHGIGFKATGANKATFVRCRVDFPDLYGIYVEGGGVADNTENKVIDCVIDASSVILASGIYVTGDNSPFTFEQRRWIVSRNIVKGHVSSTVVGITVRGYDGICSLNHVTGFLIQISCDLAQRCVISNNRCADPAAGTSYNIECNGMNNVVADNFCRGATYGFISSGAQALSGNNIHGNVFESPKSRAVYILAGAGGARNNSVIGNAILGTAAVAIAGVYFAGDCKYSLVQGNNFVGPGSGTAGGRAVYLDTVNGDIAILGNRFSGWERPVGLYNPGAVAQNRVSFSGNDCSNDMGSDSSWLSLEGSAIYGTGLVQTGNNAAGGRATEYLDRGSNVFIAQSNGFATPEGNVTAGPGSLWINTNGGASTTFFVKQTGTGNVGWSGK